MGVMVCAALRVAPDWLHTAGAVAQLGERDVRNVEVRGSIPLGSTTVLRQSGTGSCLLLPHDCPTAFLFVSETSFNDAVDQTTDRTTETIGQEKYTSGANRR